ncbi:MAG: hypothetical protein F6K04_02345 [Leptolyngbya sp. SIO4C5]|nr:hypothetical protein [Leptolyngbya sp. SIO4C5]
MPKRVYVTLPDTVADDLQRWADKRGQPLATAAAIALELYVEKLKDSGEILQAETTAETKPKQ